MLVMPPAIKHAAPEQGANAAGNLVHHRENAGDPSHVRPAHGLLGKDNRQGRRHHEGGTVQQGKHDNAGVAAYEWDGREQTYTDQKQQAVGRSGPKVSLNAPVATTPITPMNPIRARTFPATTAGTP